MMMTHNLQVAMLYACSLIYLASYILEKKSIIHSMNTVMLTSCSTLYSKHTSTFFVLHIMKCIPSDGFVSSISLEPN